MSALLKLGLGTAQFGLDYGISNTAGQPTQDEIGKILALANDVGISVVDTAPSYGDSEKRLGASGLCEYGFQVVTKTPVFSASALTYTDGDAVYNCVLESLKRFSIPKVHGVLVHHGANLLKRGGEHVIAALERLKSEGLIEKAGVSIYDSEELDQVLSVFEPEIVQLPLNILDQRLISSGHLSVLKKRGAEVHVRSLYLQGLMLMAPNMLPEYFAPLIPKLQKFNMDIADAELSPLQSCLLFGLQLDDVDALILGVTSVSELAQIIDAARNVEHRTFDFSSYAEANEMFLNPANWPQA